MVIKGSTLEKIREIVSRYHRYLLLSMSGSKNVKPSERKELEAAGLSFLAKDSALERAYFHNFLNEQGTESSPKNFEETEYQQIPSQLPKGEAHEMSVEQLNANLSQLIEKQKSDVLSRLEGEIHASNNVYKYNALQNLDRPEYLDDLVKQSSVGALKKKLKELAGDSFKNWDRIVNTEVSNAINLGSADRIVNDNKQKPASEVYVYRINPNDSRTCKYCRSFYIDSDGSPKLYKLSTVLSNGNNYGKKAVDWKPVAGATHPNCRDSQLVELRPGWKLLPGGRQTFIGLGSWSEYISKKVIA